MKKKVVIIVAAVAFVVALVAGLALSRSTPKKLAKELAVAIKSESKLEKYIEKNIDFKYAYAFDNVTFSEDENKLKEDFEKVAKEATKEQLEEYKKAAIESYILIYKKDDSTKVKFKSISGEEKYKAYPFLKYYKATYTWETKDGEKDESEIAFLYYENKLVLIVPFEYLEMDSSVEETPIEEEIVIDDRDNPLNLSQEEMDEFNGFFSEYDGETLTGSVLKELITLVVQKDEEYAGDGKRFVSLADKYIADFNDVGLFQTGTDANPYLGGYNTKENVTAAVEKMNKLKNTIKDDKNYTTSFVYGRGILVQIDINEE